MPKGKDRNYVSFWFWFLAPLVMMIPCVGIIMVFVWAFSGENESRKNFYKAMLAWWAIIIVVYAVLALAGATVVFHDQILHQSPAKK